MKLDLENMLYILIYMTFFLSIISCIAYFCKKRISHQIEYILIKNISLDMFKYSEKLEQKSILVIKSMIFGGIVAYFN